MYIKSVMIDGFKSYAQRTDITGFDPLFNAITGLNGSGKSNILDSICFLLGITNMSQVRAASLQELVYKCGQAGVNRATVSIVFENSDKNSSPIGYEQYSEITVTRQVVVGGRNKYMINGINANNTRVQDMFRSVQLNVNNPHFLIMQGRITKVLNMKPPEILSMIEEAAGTKLYESKKEASLRIIEKKNAKLAEIDSIIQEELTPQMTKLKEERSSYLNYQKIIRELEHLDKLHIAYKFFCLEETRTRCSGNLKELKDLIDSKKKMIDEANVKQIQYDEVIAKLVKNRDEQMGGEMGRIEAELRKHQAQEAKCQSSIDNKHQEIKAEDKRLKEINKNLKDDGKALSCKETEMSQLSVELEKISSEGEADQASYAEAQSNLQAVISGLSSNDEGQHASLNDQLMSAKKEISIAETEKQQILMKLEKDKEEVQKRKEELQKTENQYKKDKSNYDNVCSAVSKLQEELTKINYVDGKEDQLVETKRAVIKKMQRIKSDLDNMSSKYPQLYFEYTDPEPKFDRTKVNGLVAKLIEVNQKEMATAVEVAAGGKLYSVVVDSEITGKKLLQKGKLQRRYTIIPLNKITSKPIDPATVKRAKTLVGADNVYTALSLISYDAKLHPAMQYVFGSTFVCSNMDCAKKVAFDKNILKRCVTIDGDVFDPSGTVTGGSRPQTNAILLKVSDFRTKETEYSNHEAEISDIEKELNAIEKNAKRYKEAKHQLELKEHEASLMKSAIDQGTHQQQRAEIDKLNQLIDDGKNSINQVENIMKHNKGRVKELEKKISNADAIRERELKEAENHLKSRKKKMEQSEKLMKEKQQAMNSLVMESEELKKSVTSYEEQIKSIESNLSQFKQELKNLSDLSIQAKEKVKEVKNELERYKTMLRSCHDEIEATSALKNQLHSDVKVWELDIRETEHDIAKQGKDSKDAARHVEDLLKTYDWIAGERHHFGKPNSLYDFTSNDPKEVGKRIQQLKETKSKLEKNVNMRAMNMLGNVEEQYQDLIKKRGIIQNDKAKIIEVIHELDEKKNETLKQAWVKVNQDFGSIFSTLLPGTQAKLDQPEGQTELTGLEVRVAFGDVWKESLSELSGGQRSLIALSLILAMLLFKPAPIYILDEVDAALDLSHTQNIGQMIKKHFKHSQFIIVSLKEGMFNNANVLYKTKFIDGVSTVTRHVQQTKATGGSSTNIASNSVSDRSDKSKSKKPKRILTEVNLNE